MKSLVLYAVLNFGIDCPRPYWLSQDTPENRLWVYDNVPGACFAEKLHEKERREEAEAFEMRKQNILRRYQNLLITPRKRELK